MGPIWMANSNSTSTVLPRRRRLQMNFPIATERLRYIFICFRLTLPFFYGIFKNVNLKLDPPSILFPHPVFHCCLLGDGGGEKWCFEPFSWQGACVPIFRWRCNARCSLFTVPWMWIPPSNISWCLHFRRVNQWPFTLHVLVSGMGGIRGMCLGIGNLWTGDNR